MEWRLRSLSHRGAHVAPDDVRFKRKVVGEPLSRMRASPVRQFIIDR